MFRVSRCACGKLQKVGPRICSDHHGAQEIAALLGINHTLLDLREQFVETVVRPFAQDYLHGRTPNPCVACNRDFKFGKLLNWAKEQGADYVATGHYARIVREEGGGRISLFRGADSGKDQSYFLFALSHYQLAQTLFPLGEMQKSDVRGSGEKAGPAGGRSFGKPGYLLRRLSGSGEILRESGRDSLAARWSIGQERCWASTSAFTVLPSARGEGWEFQPLGRSMSSISKRSRSRWWSAPRRILVVRG